HASGVEWYKPCGLGWNVTSRTWSAPDDACHLGRLPHASAASNHAHYGEPSAHSNPPHAMTRWRDRIHRASRSQGFLWKFAIVTLARGGTRGYFLSRRHPSGVQSFGERVLGAAGLEAERDDDDDKPEIPESAPKLLIALAQELASPSISFARLLQAIPMLAPN